MWTVSFRGFLGAVVREFTTRERAEQWARQVGRFRDAVIAFR